VNRDVAGPTLSLVIPFKNEATTLPELLSVLAEVLGRLEESHEVILVDDGSADDSWAVLQRHRPPELTIAGLRFSRNFGKEAAIRAGLERSAGDATIVMDADLQHPPELIPEMVAAWRGSDALVVEAVRSSTYRRAFIPAVGARLVYGVLSSLAGIPLDRATDYKLLDRKVVDDLVALKERVSLFRGVVTWMGYPTASIMFDVPERPHGRSRWSVLRLTSLAIDALTGFTAFPLRIVTLFSALFIAASFVLILQTLYNYWTGNAVEGFTTVIISILLVGGVITASLGIIGEYLARVFEEVKERPTYVIADTYDPSGEG
jgi:glycosyltransferase involved in cell wall biosynthesis